MQTLPCPACREIVSASASVCRFCSTPIDPVIAAAAADNQDKVNQACSDASFLKTAAILMWVFLGLSFIPFVPLVGWGFLIVFVVVLVLLIRWHLKFSGLNTTDADYQQAKRSRTLALILWLVAIPVGFIFPTIVRLLLYGLN
jgi:Ca2+/Na+ antiporter